MKFYFFIAVSVISQACSPPTNEGPISYFFDESNTIQTIKVMDVYKNAISKADVSIYANELDFNNQTNPIYQTKTDTNGMVSFQTASYQPIFFKIQNDSLTNLNLKGGKIMHSFLVTGDTAKIYLRNLSKPNPTSVLIVYTVSGQFTLGKIYDNKNYLGQYGIWMNSSQPNCFSPNCFRTTLEAGLYEFTTEYDGVYSSFEMFLEPNMCHFKQL